MDYRERVIHGEGGLPIAIYRITPNHLRYRMNLHWHPEHEILYVRSGRLDLRLDERELMLSAGDVVFICGGTIHSAIPHRCEYDCVTFNLEKLFSGNDTAVSIAKRIENGSIIINQRVASGGAYAELCRRMGEAAEAAREAYPLLIKGCVYEFIGRIIADGLYKTESHGCTERISGKLKASISYIKENYGGKIRLETLAALADMTPNHFCRCFRELSGKTPFQYITDYRLSKAGYALISTEMSVTEIALLSGFGDVSRFISLFKAQYGVTPKRWRAENGA